MGNVKVFVTYISFPSPLFKNGGTLWLILTIKKQKEYSELAYQIGKLYWFYYDYGKTDNYDNQITRAKSAVQWFSDAIEYGTPQDTYRAITKAYQTIGEFYQNVTLNVEEASDKGTYLPYMNNPAVVLKA